MNKDQKSFLIFGVILLVLLIILTLIVLKIENKNEMKCNEVGGTQSSGSCYKEIEGIVYAGFVRELNGELKFVVD